MEMKEISIEEKKYIAIEILEQVHEFCMKNNIRYFLYYGSLLGAVRHKGFIPWDDDIDICMPRPDYERFLKIFKDNKFDIANYRDNKYLPIIFSKVYNKNTVGILNNGRNINYGVAVDIFPLDGFDYCKVLYLKNLYRLYNITLFPLINDSEVEESFIKKIIKAIMNKIISPRTIAKKIDKYAAKQSYENSKRVTTLVENMDLRITEKKCYENIQNLVFEGNNCCVPYDYNSVLTCLYGPDYMTPPPENQRESLHTEKYYWK